MEKDIFNLNLLSPVIFTEGGVPAPFFSEEEAGEGEEKLYCFELDGRESVKFEPDTLSIPGALVYSGAGFSSAGCTGAGQTIQLPKGNYLFAQKRKILCKDEIIALAVEIQQEGLWRRLELGDKLYLRYLFEDRSWVTQLYRQVKGS